MLTPVYIRALANCPFCIKVKFSPVKDENVVNPPQNPAIKKIRKLGEIISVFAVIPIIKPMSKLPKMFTVKVPIGIDKKCNLTFSFCTINRVTLPIKPPNPTINNCFIFY